MENANEILWTSGFFNERFPAPVSPLGWSHLGPLIEETALRDPLRFLGFPGAETILLTRVWHGHPYANALAFQIFYKVFPDFILPEDAYRYFPDGNVALRKYAPYPRWVDAPRFVCSLLRAFLSDPFNVSPLNNYRHWARHIHKHDAHVATVRARFAELTNADAREIFAALRETSTIHRDFLRIHRWSLMDADLTFGLLKRLVGKERAARLVADVPNKTLEIDAALHRLAIDNSQSAIRNFLVEHGHRSFSLDIAMPTFADEPAQVERLINSTDDGRRKTENANASSIVRPAEQSSVIFPILALARHYVALREDQRYYWQKSLAAARQLYLMLADRLVRDGVIENRDSVFYAIHTELENYFAGKLPKTELARIIAARQTQWREYQREFEQAPTASYPAFLRGDESLVKNTTQVATPHLTNGRIWRGRAVSPGIARGIARVVQSASDLSRVQSGEILVAPATDPAWTPVFARIAGLVVERGGVLSHSAVVAREYHLPAVAGIVGIVSEIRDGDVMEVDGSKGIVKLVQ